LARRIMIPTSTMMRIVKNLTSRNLSSHSQSVKGMQVSEDGLDRRGPG
jgi:hypothetical protein